MNDETTAGKAESPTEVTSNEQAPLTAPKTDHDLTTQEELGTPAATLPPGVEHTDTPATAEGFEPVAGTPPAEPGEATPYVEPRTDETPAPDEATETVDQMRSVKAHLSGAPTGELVSAHAAITGELNARGVTPTASTGAAPKPAPEVAHLSNDALTDLHGAANNEIVARGLAVPPVAAPVLPVIATTQNQAATKTSLLANDIRNLSETETQALAGIKNDAQNLFKKVEGLGAGTSMELQVAMNKVKEVVMWVEHFFTK